MISEPPEKYYRKYQTHRREGSIIKSSKLYFKIHIPRFYFPSSLCKHESVDNKLSKNIIGNHYRTFCEQME